MLLQTRRSAFAAAFQKCPVVWVFTILAGTFGDYKFTTAIGHLRVPNGTANPVCRRHICVYDGTSKSMPISSKSTRQNLLIAEREGEKLLLRLAVPIYRLLNISFDHLALSALDGTNSRIPIRQSITSGCPAALIQYCTRSNSLFYIALWACLS